MRIAISFNMFCNNIFLNFWVIIQICSLHPHLKNTVFIGDNIPFPKQIL